MKLALIFLLTAALFAGCGQKSQVVQTTGDTNRFDFDAANTLVESRDPAKVREGFLRFQTAARAGDLSAQIKLGTLYHRGVGVEGDVAKAVVWFQRAAAQGDRNATQMAEGLARAVSREQIEAARRAEFESSGKP